ncbi:nicotinate-nucleotide pyrophosphorylase [carboxylating] [Alkalispirochaeta americana]|uniref:Probable nicotinate-nucleotide pyrophosphorylase [carboxylating] n=1 Tax=Alkalispirochaeta americana TaxID=159291 RepID=A0A1N6T4S1_9SPIO|nr:carboxylating nicotinate-nucleotide diphosphorylase [Alkalispirochaeta americana]SIQ48329.1 nicotinate-nucleotide pyrophosphorylase [carboxylating] [Alkalispirochaeta americana]
MKTEQDYQKGLPELIDRALEEDLGGLPPKGLDITSEAIFSDETGQFSLIAKESGVLCGKEVVSAVVARVDPSVRVSWRYNDGDSFSGGAVIASLDGSVRTILQAERTALNFLSHLSGIATRTAEFVHALGGRSVLLDTRKTVPGYRLLQKYAVRCGGGENHRTGLYDMVMIKDNHIDAAGGIMAAVERVRTRWGDRYKIEVEARTLKEVEDALACGVDRIMLDNMSDHEMSQAVKLVAGRAETEASGTMTRERIARVAPTGVDYISFGMLTHTVIPVDFSLRTHREG